MWRVFFFLVLFRVIVSCAITEKPRDNNICERNIFNITLTHCRPLRHVLQPVQSCFVKISHAHFSWAIKVYCAEEIFILLKTTPCGNLFTPISAGLIFSITDTWHIAKPQGNTMWITSHTRHTQNKPSVRFISVCLVCMPQASSSLS